MKTIIEPTAEDLLRAEQYWQEKEFQVKKIAEQMGLDIKFEWDFLYELFNYGEAELTDKQVMEVLKKDFA